MDRDKGRRDGPAKRDSGMEGREGWMRGIEGNNDTTQ